MARIVTVYRRQAQPFAPIDMSYIRWLKISEALARAGHEVDIATNEPTSWWRRPSPIAMGPRLRRVPLQQIRWDEYDVVKTLFHMGIETLEQYGGTAHPFIISKFGSVVGSTDMDGVPFYGKIRRGLFEIQERAQRISTYITLLSPAAQDLWRTCFGPVDNLLLVPGGVDASIPAAQRDPFPAGPEIRCLFAGNVYVKGAQPEANRILIGKLNRLGSRLRARNARLFLLGPGDTEALDPNCVTALGAVSYDQTWDYFHHAHVGIVVAGGTWLHNNESSKIYHYLRAGLPVVLERAFPNAHVVEEAGLGFIVPGDDMDAMADRIHAAATAVWDRQRAIDYVLARHTWDCRVRVYDDLIRSRSETSQRVPEVR